MDILFINRTNSDVEIYRNLFETITASTIKTLNLKKNYEVSVTFVRSRTIHTINRDYRGIDRITDVITFAAQDGEVLMIDEAETDLGDIFINIDYAKKQANQYGHSLEREVGFLFTHGLLHCLGYDHMTEEEEKEMFHLQDVILNPIVSRK